MAIGDGHAGRLESKLNDDDASKTAHNFREFAQGVYGFDYKNTTFHGVILNMSMKPMKGAIMLDTFRRPTQKGSMMKDDKILLGATYRAMHPDEQPRVLYFLLPMAKSYATGKFDPQT